MPHDIIDNLNEKLIDHVERILSSTERAEFAVGYLFLSGLKPLQEHLSKLKEIRLLIGNTTDRETLEMLAEGYRNLEAVQEDLEDWRFRKRALQKQAAVETRENLREALALMDQTDEDETVIRGVLELIEADKLKVRVYTKGRLHAKAYIFGYGPIFDTQGQLLPREEQGIAIVGSSNLTLSGLTHNTELNVLVHGNANYHALSEWFERLWDESQNFDKSLMQELKRSWAIGVVGEREGEEILVRPYDIYMKTLYELVKDRLGEEEKREILWDDQIIRDLTQFQRAAVKQAIQMIHEYGGGFIADVVGLGKSYIGAAVIKHFERTDGARPLIICPKGLVEMWERYNEFYHLNARVLSMGLLREAEDGSNILLLNPRYRDRDFILVDESHNFRYPNTQRYQLLQEFITTPTADGRRRRAVLLTATPQNKSPWDIYHQIKLFHLDEQIGLPIDPPSLRDYFRLVERGERQLQDMLAPLLIRRTRSYILRWYGYDSETGKPVDPAKFNDYRSGKRRAYIIVGGKRRFFPKRELVTITYSIEATYQGLYDEIRGYIGRSRKNQLEIPPGELTYAKYGLWHYVYPHKQRQSPYAELHQAGANLRGLMRVLLFKRLESSVAAFRETVMKLLRIHQDFLTSMGNGIIPAGEEAQQLLYESDELEETTLMTALEKLTGRYNIEDFQVDLLKKHIEQDIQILGELLGLVTPIPPEKDAKLQTLLERLSQPPLAEGKKLIFTQYADTARYLYENLNPNGERDDIDVIYSSEKSRDRVVGRFAPKANPWYRPRSGESELQIVIATDVLAEGLNLQDCDKVINYDLHWNPVRLIQRLGRIDRIGSEKERVWAFNFLPEKGIERHLGLHDRLAQRIQEIHDTIGEDAAILDPTERLNEIAMYAIYEGRAAELCKLEEDEERFDLNEAEEILRQLRNSDPEEFERIRNLSDGLRTAKSSDKKGTFVFLRAGRYQQLNILDESGEPMTQELSQVLSALRCDVGTPALELPQDHNAIVSQAKARFSRNIRQIQAQADHSMQTTQAQRYVLDELRLLYRQTLDEHKREQIAILEEAFRNPLTTALNRSLTRLKRNKVIGDPLLRRLVELYYQHNLKERIGPSAHKLQTPPTKIICSEALF
ncbi:helicase [bacterium]|nr:MAG: helicase [bacterium]